MLGLLAAVERYLDLDHDARERYCENTVNLWCEAFNRIEGLTSCRTFPNEAGQPLPRCYIKVESALWSRDDIVEQLATGSPAIMVEATADGGIHLNPMTLAFGEEEIVLKRLLEIVQ
jgi:L-seryl-tRNA(Ser) seleniumtransferase